MTGNLLSDEGRTRRCCDRDERFPNTSQWLNDALGDLSDREQMIIRERHLGEDVATLETLGKELGVSKERVRQLEARAMDKLRHPCPLAQVYPILSNA